MNDDGHDSGLLKQFITLVFGLVFRIIFSYVGDLFKAKKKQEVKDEPPESPGC